MPNEQNNQRDQHQQGNPQQGGQNKPGQQPATPDITDAAMMRLTAFNGKTPGALMVLFTDATSGVTTYAANRVLQVDPPALVRGHAHVHGLQAHQAPCQEAGGGDNRDGEGDLGHDERAAASSRGASHPPASPGAKMRDEIRASQ